MATEAQMDDLIRAVNSISLESEGSPFDNDDIHIVTHSLYRIANSLDEISSYLKPKTEPKVVSQTPTDRSEIYIKLDQLESLINGSQCADKQRMLTSLNAIKDRI